MLLYPVPNLIADIIRTIICLICNTKPSKSAVMYWCDRGINFVIRFLEGSDSVVFVCYSLEENIFNNFNIFKMDLYNNTYDSF